MSTAKITKQLAVHSAGRSLVIEPGIEIRRIKRRIIGYSFQAGIGGGWYPCVTGKNLLEYIELSRRGRPRLPGERRPMAIRLSKEQRQWLETRADFCDLTASEYVREKLREGGMPE